MHTSWEENYERGYEWWLMVEAKKVHVISNMGLVARKTVFGVSDKASFKPGSSATETS